MKKTYNTYQEAKIAMPLACIIEDTDSGLFFGMPTREGTTLAGGSRFAEPQYYCMTVEKFLADGYRFAEGDLFIGTSGEVVDVECGGHLDEMHVAHGSDKYRYILRAAALEEKKPRTKVEYLKCEFSREWEAVKYYNEEGELFVIDCNGNYSNVNDISGAWYEVVCRNYDSIYRRIETPMTERETFIEEMSRYATPSVLGKMFDSGCRFVSQDSDFLRSRIRAVAEWEMNTSNNHDWESVAESIYCAVDGLLKS